MTLTWLDAQAQIAALERGDISSVELLDGHLQALDERNPRLNVVVTTDRERARSEAGAIDQRRASGDDVGALGGLPVTIKDSLMTKGMRTTSGAQELADYVPDTDADVVKRFRQQGAVIYGKTNLPRYANDVQSYNSVFGTSNNPYDLGRSVGGSSGGSAGAVAAGLSSLEIGSDIAGSIRNPAAMCGIVGHKPSYGIVSARGQIPGPPGTLTQADLAVVGPMARTAEDCAFALDILAGPDSWYAPAWSLTLPAPRTPSPKGLRVAVMASDSACPVDPEIENRILEVAEALGDAGSVISHEARPSGFDFAKAERTFWNLLGAALSGGYTLAELEEIDKKLRSGQVVAGDLGIVGASQRHRGWLSENERRLQMRRNWLEFFENWDVLLAPVAPTVAIPHDHHQPASERRIQVAGEDRPYSDLMSWMGVFGLVYLPATSVPIGLHSNGLPIGLQVVAPFLYDHTALAVAGWIEELRDAPLRPPFDESTTGLEVRAE